MRLVKVLNSFPVSPPPPLEELQKYRLQWCKVSWRQRNLNFRYNLSLFSTPKICQFWWYLKQENRASLNNQFIVGFICFYVTFCWIISGSLDIDHGLKAPGLRMKPTMVEGPNSPLYISLPRSSIMPRTPGCHVVACVFVGRRAVKCDVICL